MVMEVKLSYSVIMGKEKHFSLWISSISPCIFFLFTLQHFFEALPHFQLFPLSLFHLFASFCRNVAVEVKIKATASD